MTQQAYNNGFPAQCPPVGAEYVTRDLYKAINGRQPNQRDFDSFAEKDRPGTDKMKCNSWGLSVWPDMAAVEHGRSAIPAFRKKKIIRFSVTPNDGCLAYTPSAAQPDHHTFWKFSTCNLLNTCEIIPEFEAA